MPDLLIERRSRISVGSVLRAALLILSLALAGVVGLLVPYGLLILAVVVTGYLLAIGGRAAFAADAAAVLFLGAFAILGVAHGLSAETPGDVLFVLNFVYLALFAPLVSLYRASTNPERAKRVADLALLGSMFMLLLGAVEMHFLGAPRVGYLSTDPIRFGAAATILGYLSLFGLQVTKGRQRWLYLSGPLCALVTILLTGSRGALVAFAILAIIAALMLARRKGMAFALVVVVILSTIVLVWSSGMVGASRMASLAEIAKQLLAGEEIADAELSIRLDLYQAGVRAFLDAPLFGHGWSRLTEAPQQYISSGIRISKYAHLHNDLLNFAVAGGLLGVIAYFAIIAAPLVAAWRSPRDSLFSLRLYGCAVLCSAYVLLGSTSLMLGFEYPTALYIGLAAVLLGYLRDSQPGTPITHGA